MSPLLFGGVFVDLCTLLFQILYLRMVALLRSYIVAFRLPVFVLFTLGPSLLVAADCSTPPIVIPVTNVTLADNIVSRGASISLGSPPQNLAFIANG